MKDLRNIERKYWDEYLASLAPERRPRHAKVEASFAGSREITDELLDLYLSGKKTAGSSIAEDFIFSGDPLPQIGNFWIYLDSATQPRCILRTTKIVTNKFKDVPLKIAIAEGEGDLSLEYWRRVHSEIYSPFLSQWGVSNIDEASVITEFYELVYR